jgi:ubiquinone/menaquinone biosynthesis C-methylase UbiE
VALLLEAFTSEPDVVLELGCGACQYRGHVRGRYYGLDLTSGYYAGGRPGVLGDAQSLPFGTGTIDLVFCVATLCAIPVPDRVLAECRRVLRPGGHVLIFDYKRRVARRLPDARQQFTARALRQLLRRHAFRPRTHWLCLPAPGVPGLRWATTSRWARLLAFPVNPWLVVSGRRDLGDAEVERAA